MVREVHLDPEIIDNQWKENQRYPRKNVGKVLEKARRGNKL